MLVWLTQLGLSTAVPLGGFVLLGLWLKNQLGWGQWVLWAGIVLGGVCAVRGFYDSLKTLSRLTKKEGEAPPVSFNEHD